MDSPDCDAHDPGPDHPETRARLVAIREGLRARDLDVALEHQAPTHVERALLERVHSSAYIDRVERACARVSRARLDEDTVVSGGSYAAALAAAGAGVGAVRRVLEGSWTRAFCSVRPPGHHARRDESAGFCIFNNVAIACEAALDDPRVNRVAILDFDAHRGDGTDLLFDGRDEVTYASWHQHLHYPGPPALPSNGINCPLPLGATSAAFLRVWRERVRPALEDFSPDLLLLSAGFDADRRDPYSELAMDALGYFDLTREIVGFSNAYCRGRIVSVLEGGYDAAALAEDAAAHVEALLERPYYR